MARFRLLTQLVPTRFVLRTVCPGIFAYAKATGWPSSRTQLLRDRQLVDVSLRSFYASLRPSRLRHQTLTKVQTSKCPVLIYSQRAPRTKGALGKGAGFWTSLGASSGGNAVLSTLSAMMGSPEAAPSGGLVGPTSRASPGEQAKDKLSDAAAVVGGLPPQAGPPPMPATEDDATKDFASLAAIRASVEQQERHAEAVLTTEGPRAPSVNHLPSQQRGGWVEAAVKIAALLHSDWGGADRAGAGGGGGGEKEKEKTEKKRRSVCADSRRVSASSSSSSSFSSAFTAGEDTEKQQKWIFFLHGGAFVFNTPDSYKLFINGEGSTRTFLFPVRMR